jgi:integrase
MAKAKETEKVRGVYEKERGSGIWWIRWTDAAGDKRREKVGRLSDAKTLLAKKKTEKLQQTKLPEMYGVDVLFSDLLDDALEHSKAENGERSTHELKLKIDRIRPEWGSRKAKDITKQEIVRWLQHEKVERKWSPATMNRYQACFSLAFRVGMENAKIVFNPASLIVRKEENNQQDRFLSPDEEAAITKVLKKRFPMYLPAFIFSINTGLRASEQWRLRWRDIDIYRRQVTVLKQKSGKPPRRIGLNQDAIAALQNIRPENPSDNDPVFLNSANTPMTSHREWFDPAVAEAKVENFTWHANRHTFASRLAMAGVPIATIAQLLGHGTIQMTMRYAHLSPDANLDAVDRIAGFKRKDTKSDTAPRKLQLVK